ncbi:MAG: UDP-2,3-diacylglucosamine diphosphatase LpxI [Pseudomonadota bacterium]
MASCTPPARMPSSQSSREEPAADGPLGVIAGAGALPRKVIAAAERQGRPCLVVGFAGHTDEETLAAAPSFLSRLGAAGSIVKRLRAEGVRDVVMAGAIRRPSLLQLKPDLFTARVLTRIGMRALGDDSLLRAIIALIEEEGFTVRSAQEITGDLVIGEGLLGQVRPDEQAEADIRRGFEVAEALGLVDVGQSVVVQQGIVLGVEAVEGTDALLQRCGPLARGGVGGVLVKAMKPNQDQRADLPTIGPETVRKAAAAGLRGLALRAGGALIIDREEMVREADRLKLFIIGVKKTKHD